MTTFWILLVVAAICCIVLLQRAKSGTRGADYFGSCRDSADCCCRGYGRPGCCCEGSSCDCCLPSGSLPLFVTGTVARWRGPFPPVGRLLLSLPRSQSPTLRLFLPL